jgi:hypothetical protein
MHPTPIQGRTRKRAQRDPGALPVFKSREVTGDVIKFVVGEFPAQGDNLIVRFDDKYETFLTGWIKKLYTGGVYLARYSATIDDGTQIFQMRAWPLKFVERGQVQFRYDCCTNA